MVPFSFLYEFYGFRILIDVIKGTISSIPFERESLIELFFWRLLSISIKLDWPRIASLTWSIKLRRAVRLLSKDRQPIFQVTVRHFLPDF